MLIDCHKLYTRPAPGYEIASTIVSAAMNPRRRLDDQEVTRKRIRVSG